MIIKIQMWGNSLALRIPKSFAKEIGLQSGASVNLSLEEGKLVIEPLTAKEYCLEELLFEVNEDNIHTEFDTGKPKGKELW